MDHQPDPAPGGEKRTHPDGEKQRNPSEEKQTDEDSASVLEDDTVRHHDARCTEGASNILQARDTGQSLGSSREREWELDKYLSKYPQYPLYQLFMQYAINHRVPPHLSVTWRDRSTAYMNNIIKTHGRLITASFPNKDPKVNKDPKATSPKMDLKCYELFWNDIEHQFLNVKEFFVCCSLLHDFMPQDEQSGHPYPLKISIKLFGHQGAIYVISKAQIFNSNEPSMHGLYITTDDDDFLGTKLCDKGKDPKRNMFNFDAYLDISDILTGRFNVDKDKERQKTIAKYLIDTLDSKADEPETRPYPMHMIRAMWMAIAIPFIAEIVPPPDQGIINIQSVCSQLITGASLDDVQADLKGHGGNNPGSHIFCYNLYKGIRDGNNTFRNVLLYPYPKSSSTLKCPIKDCEGHITKSERKGPDPEYTCSMQRRGVWTYRINTVMNFLYIPYVNHTSVLNAYVTNNTFPACETACNQSSQAGVHIFFGFREKLDTELQRACF